MAGTGRKADLAGFLETWFVDKKSKIETYTEGMEPQRMCVHGHTNTHTHYWWPWHSRNGDCGFGDAWVQWAGEIWATADSKQCSGLLRLVWIKVNLLTVMGKWQTCFNFNVFSSFPGLRRLKSFYMFIIAVVWNNKFHNIKTKWNTKIKQDS